MVSLLALTHSLLAVAHTRLELLGHELESERAHLLSWLVLIQVMLFFLGLGVVLASIAIVMAVEDVHRLPVLTSLAAFFVIVGVTAAWFANSRARGRPRLFQASLAELRQDIVQAGKSL